MKWYGASIIVAVRSNKAEAWPLPVEENVILIEAANDDQAMEEAKKVGEKYNDPEVSRTLRLNHRPAHFEFIGVRKLISVSNPSPLRQDQDRPVHGTELTYSTFEIADEEALKRLANGEDVAVRYIE